MNYEDLDDAPSTFKKKKEKSVQIKTTTKPIVNWSMLKISELIQCMDEIKAVLPPLELAKINLEEEVLTQFHTVRELQSEVLAESHEDISSNQKAAVVNTVSAILKSLADRQEALYSSERFKDIENLMIKHLSNLGEEFAKEFLDEYKIVLRKYTRTSE